MNGNVALQLRTLMALFMMKAVLVSVYSEKRSNTAQEHLPLKQVLRA